MEEQTGRVVGALFAALVEALEEKSPGLARGFARHLEDAIARLRDEGPSSAPALDSLVWTKSLLSEDLDRTEPASVVYAKIRALEEEHLPSSEKVQLPSLEEALRFWSRLPDFDRKHAAIETASGRRFDAAAAAALVRRFRDRPAG